MKLSTFTAGVARLIFPLCLSATSLADIIYVDASGNGQFTAFQPAINAALDGDVLLARTGTYAGFTLDNRALWIVADAGAVAKINTTVTVRNTASNKIVLLSGIEIEGATGTPGQLGMLLENNASHVRVQGCTVRGGEGDYYANNAPGGHAVSIVNSTKVALVGCSLTGGMGGGIPFFVSLGGRGGDGVVTHGSIVAFYDCLLKGGIGGQADYISPNERAGDGGDGCHVLDYGILASGCQFQGGMGGGGASIPGDGGNGLRADAGQAQYIGSTFAGGSGGFGYYGNVGANGQPQIGSGVFNQIAGSARKISAPALAAENSTLQVQLSGEPGDRFWLLQTRFPEFIYSPSFAGVRLVLTLALSLSVPHATLPAAGTVTVPIFVPDVGVGTPVARQYWQCLVVSASGQIRLGSALHVAVLNCSDLMPDCDGNGSCDSCDLLLPTAVDCDKNGVPDSCQPDCNGNGLADPCDIASGTSIDQNHNGIPDECESPSTWHVDASAAPGGNGSAGAPFQTLAPAFSAAISGDTLLIANGLYQGSGNRNLDFGGRDLIVESSGGAANCIIDPQLQAQAFSVGAGVTSASRIQGLTIRNGKVPNNYGSGGGVLIQNSSPTVRQCVFESCQGTSGAGLAMHSSSSLIEGCIFVGNSISVGPYGYGGGAYVSECLDARIVDCNFVDNFGQNGGGLSTSGGSVHIERCLFLTNLSGNGTGGGIYSYYSEIFVDQCLIAGNSASLGGAIAGYASNWHLTGSTVVDNKATQRAGAAYFSYDNASLREWRNTIFRNNTAPGGTAIEVLRGPLDIAWCDVQGGQTSVTVGALASLVWGPGNFDQDPLFVDPDGPDNNLLTIFDNDYRLSLTSPCLDAGENASVAPDWFDLDGDGNVIEPVPFDFDGATRFVDIPSAPNTGSGVSPIVDLGAWERP